MRPCGFPQHLSRHTVFRICEEECQPSSSLSMLQQYVTDEFFEGIALSESFTFRQRKKAYIVGDLDALRQVYSLKGSSGLRCCIRCKNVLKLNSGCVNHDRYFVEISSARGFDPNTDTEIWNTCDRFSSCRTKTELHQLEKVSGITLI